MASCNGAPRAPRPPHPSTSCNARPSTSCNSRPSTCLLYLGLLAASALSSVGAVSVDLSADVRQREVMRREALPHGTEQGDSLLAGEQASVPPSQSDWFKQVMKDNPEKDVHYQDKSGHGELKDAHAKFRRTVETVMKWKRWRARQQAAAAKKNETKPVPHGPPPGNQDHAKQQAHQRNQGPKWDPSMRPPPPPPPENVTIYGNSSKSRLEEYDEEMKAAKEHSTAGSSATGGAIVPIAFLFVVFVCWAIYNTCQPVKRRKPDEEAAAGTGAAAAPAATTTSAAPASSSSALASSLAAGIAAGASS